jgi:regulator of sirC expression with transglutaminase-like and TPR domain
MPVPLSFDVPVPLDYFAALVAEDAGFPTLEAAIAIGQDATPTLDTQAVLFEIDQLAARLASKLPVDASPAHRVGMLNRYFFRELGFAGNVNDFHDPANSYLHRVLVTRLGIPISLALLYVELARHIGLRACGVSFPGHFLVKLSLPNGDMVVDPLNGDALSRTRLEERLEPFRQQPGMAGDFEAPLGLFLQAAAPRDILARMLRNLKHCHQMAGDKSALLAVQQRLVRLLPEAWEERRDRGLTLLAAGCPEAALPDLEAYLSHRPAAADAQALLRQVAELRDSTRPHRH